MVVTVVWHFPKICPLHSVGHLVFQIPLSFWVPGVKLSSVKHWLVHIILSGLVVSFNVKIYPAWHDK